MEVLFNPDQANEGKEVIFLRKTIKIIYPPLSFNNATVKLTPLQKHPGLQLDSKQSFNDHTNNRISKATNNRISKATKVIVHPHKLTMVMIFMTNRPMHHFQTKLKQCNITPD